MANLEAQDVREMIGRFRVLIIGRTNAGKTTILQKVCNTTDDPEIYDTKGKKIDNTAVTSSINRGNHNIANEMVFKSSPGFIFHDSCGFEVGSEKEFENMKEFISERVHATKLGERIHAIWYCIPMDEPSRTFQRSEEKFFLECDTGHVPVIAVFTKFEALRPVAYGEIKKQLKGLSTEERSQRIAQRVEEVFTNTGVWDRLCDPANRARPKSYVRLENMNKPNTSCNSLLERTTLALDNGELRLCLISTQQSNMELCIKCAVGTLVDRAHRQFGPLPINYEDHQFDIAKWFPHLNLYAVPWTTAVAKSVFFFPETASEWADDTFGLLGSLAAGMVPLLTMPVLLPAAVATFMLPEKAAFSDEVADFNHNLFNAVITWRKDIIRILQPLAAKGSLSTAVNRIIQTGIATIIVLEYSAFLPKKSNLEHVQSAVDYYMKSPTAIAVEKGAKEISSQGYKKEELGKKILEFILENRMSKDLTAKN